MIGNFSDDFGDLYVFFDEGDVENLDEGPVTGLVADIDNPDLGPASLEVVYDESLHGSRPLIGREQDDSVGDVQVVIEDKVYGELVDGEAYTGSVGRYNSVPARSEIALVPAGSDQYQDVLEELDDMEFI